jgi:hypothetical protein
MFRLACAAFSPGEVRTVVEMSCRRSLKTAIF